MSECDKSLCDGEIEEIDEGYYKCDTCDEFHTKIGNNFVLENSEVLEEIKFAECKDCGGILYKTQTGRDIYLKCSGCTNDYKCL